MKINEKEIPEDSISEACRVIESALKRLFADQKNVNDFEEWQKCRNEEKEKRK